MRAVVSAFQGKTVKRRPGMKYLIGLLLGSLGLALLFLSYIGIVVAGIYYLWVYLSQVVPESFSKGQVNRLLLARDIGIVVAWILMLYALIGPFFSFERRKRRGRKIEFVEAPGLHAFTKALCEVIHAPVPVEIRLLPEPTVSAAYRGGLFGLFTRQVVLGIGAPLIAGLEMRQLAGIVAQEAGHFSQEIGSSLSIFVRVITSWFAKAAEISESTTEQFSESDRSNRTILGTIYRLINLSAAIIGQVVLRLVLLLSYLMGLFILRRQEFDSDRYQAEVAGSETFPQTLLRMRLLNAGYDAAKTLLSERSTPTPLPASFTEWALRETERIDPEHKNELAAQLISSRTGLLDSRPSAAERIDAVKQNPQPGLFSFTAPARLLVPNLEQYAVEVSPKSYRRLLRDSGKKPTRSS